jgi:hypothetical protein
MVFSAGGEPNMRSSARFDLSRVFRVSHIMDSTDLARLLNETAMSLDRQIQAERSWTPKCAVALKYAVGAQLALS